MFEIRAHHDAKILTKKKFRAFFSKKKKMFFTENQKGDSLKD